MDLPVKINRGPDAPCQFYRLTQAEDFYDLYFKGPDNAHKAVINIQYDLLSIDFWSTIYFLCC